MITKLQELVEYYEGLGHQSVSASLVVSGLKSLENTPTSIKICHRSMSAPVLRKCVGKTCDRYANCEIAWKRAKLDRKTYNLPEEE